VAQKQYEALRMFFREGVKAKKVAHKFGYTYRGFTTIVSEFRKKLQNPDIVDPFFIEKNKGRKTSNTVNEAKDMIVEMRKKYYSVDYHRTWKKAKPALIITNDFDLPF
jgi:hypothetical protein